MDDRDLLATAAGMALSYAGSVDDRPTTPTPEALAALAAFDEPLSDGGRDPADTLRLLADVGAPATVASTGGRYFGFVTGATYPVALGAAWLTSAWDQNAALPAMSPVAARLHDVVRAWLVDLLRLPADTGLAFVTGATVANAACLAAARDALLARLGWDAQADGLFGAPPLPVVIGERAHSTLAKSLGLVGLGRDARARGARRRPGQAAGRPAARRGRSGAGVRAGRARSTPARSTRSTRSPTGSPSGAAGCTWTAPSGCGHWPTRRGPHLVGGLERADSWATDGHKWLNVGYDCGLAFVRDLGDLRRTFTATAGYLPASAQFEAMHHTPQSSQRARQVEVWAVLRTLGRAGVAELVARSCAAARTIADALAAGGLTVLNDVVLNQVLVRLVDGPTTEALVAAVQADGRVWCGPAVWDGASAMRMSVSSWKTGPAEAADAAAAILECAAQARKSASRT